MTNPAKERDTVRLILELLCGWYNRLHTKYRRFVLAVESDTVSARHSKFSVSHHDVPLRLRQRPPDAYNN